MKTQKKTRVLARDGSQPTVILGTYRYWIIAWLRGVIYISSSPQRTVFLDEIS